MPRLVAIAVYLRQQCHKWFTCFRRLNRRNPFRPELRPVVHAPRLMRRLRQSHSGNRRKMHRRHRHQFALVIDSGRSRGLAPTPSCASTMLASPAAHPSDSSSKPSPPFVAEMRRNHAAFRPENTPANRRSNRRLSSRPRSCESAPRVPNIIRPIRIKDPRQPHPSPLRASSPSPCLPGPSSASPRMERRRSGKLRPCHPRRARRLRKANAARPAPRHMRPYPSNPLPLSHPH